MSSRTSTNTNIPIMVASSDRIYSPHHHAKELNNLAAHLLNRGNYNEGIATLTRALKLTRVILTKPQGGSRANGISEAEAAVSPCSYTMSYSFLNDQDKYDREAGDQTNPRRIRGRRRPIQQDSFEEEGTEQDSGFIYLHPLLLNEIAAEENHGTGIALSFAVVFNLAVAHHAKATKTVAAAAVTTNGKEQVGSKVNLQMSKALKLYELAHQLHNDWCRRQDAAAYEAAAAVDPNNHEMSTSAQEHQKLFSLRFAMIISNNLGEIYRVTGSSAKHKQSIQYLLSTIMYGVDRNLGAFHPDSVEMDGFCRSVSPVLLGIATACARAA